MQREGYAIVATGEAHACKHPLLSERAAHYVVDP